MITFPPSPAPSACDSLVDIADLDAFLNSQGSLSHFPTPPPSQASYVEEAEIYSEDDEFLVDVNLDYIHVAAHFCTVVNTRPLVDHCQVVLIEDILLRAQLPPEILALTYNILIRYRTRETVDHSQQPPPPGLLTVCCMSLATSCASDHAPNSSFWTDLVCNGAYSSRDIDRSLLHILATLDWTIHSCSSPPALEDALEKLSSRRPPPAHHCDAVNDPRSVKSGQQPNLRLDTATSSACWVDGQLTPELTPPCCSRIETTALRFLPLLS